MLRAVLYYVNSRPSLRAEVLGKDSPVTSLIKSAYDHVVPEDVPAAGTLDATVWYTASSANADDIDVVQDTPPPRSAKGALEEVVKAAAIRFGQSALTRRAYRARLDVLVTRLKAVSSEPHALGPEDRRLLTAHAVELASYASPKHPPIAWYAKDAQKLVVDNVMSVDAHPRIADVCARTTTRVVFDDWLAERHARERHDLGKC